MLIRRIDSGKIIREADVAWRRLRVSALGNGTVASMEEFIGMNTRRPLRADTAVRRADLKTPVLIAKGSSVKMVLPQRRPPAGRARAVLIEDGAAGQEIRIMNLHSKSIVLGHSNWFRISSPFHKTASSASIEGMVDETSER